MTVVIDAIMRPVMTKRAPLRPAPEPGTRERMVAGAADLLRRRGVRATSLRDVVEHTRTPRGSLAHHFPGGKSELIEEAVDYARRHVTDALGAALATYGAREGLRRFFAQWRSMLQATGYAAGCPVMAVAIEEDEDSGAAATSAGPTLRAHAAFEEWTGLIATTLRREGLTQASARSVAVMVVAAFEGAIGLARAARSAGPLDEVARQLEAFVDAALRQESRPRRARNVSNRTRP